jgi:hypothetical protein
MISYDAGTKEQQVMAIMTRPEAFKSYLDNRHHGLTFYDYVKMIVTEYEKIAINVNA